MRNSVFPSFLLQSAQERMTENVHTLVRYVNEREGDIIIDAEKAVNTPFQLR